MKTKRFTLVFHHYIGYGSYQVIFKRVMCLTSSLKFYEKDDLHFIIDGWPKIVYPRGETYFSKKSAK